MPSFAYPGISLLASSSSSNVPQISPVIVVLLNPSWWEVFSLHSASSSNLSGLGRAHFVNRILLFSSLRSIPFVDVLVFPVTFSSCPFRLFPLLFFWFRDYLYPSCPACTNGAQNIKLQHIQLPARLEPVTLRTGSRDERTLPCGISTKHMVCIGWGIGVLFHDGASTSRCAQTISIPVRYSLTWTSPPRLTRATE